MDIFQQCQNWHENDEYQNIIDALEAMPAEERSPEMDSELARAYNNLANHNEPKGREMLKTALSLLKPHEEYFAEDHIWNFRIGYSYFYLDQAGRALPHFQKALKTLPDDEDTKWFIGQCESLISLPRFMECFRERTEKTWDAFVQQEGQLRQIIDSDKNYERGQEIVNIVNEVLDLAFADISFELGFNGQKYDLILTPNGDEVKLFELVYFRNQAPSEIAKHWNILIGHQPIESTGLRLDDGSEVSGEDVQVWLEKLDKDFVSLFVYCEKLLPILKQEEGKVWWILRTLTDQALGELACMLYVGSFEVLPTPKPEPSMTMDQLSDELRKQGFSIPTDTEDYLSTYMCYEGKANEDQNADWRLDVFTGVAACTPLINSYLSADNGAMDNLHDDGAVAGFIAYPLGDLIEVDSSDKLFAFRGQLEEVLSTPEAAKLLTLTGGATGIYCGYVDFIAWDLTGALELARRFFDNSDIPWAVFHTFRREAGTVILKKSEEAKEEYSQD